MFPCAPSDYRRASLRHLPRGWWYVGDWQDRRRWPRNWNRQGHKLSALHWLGLHRRPDRILGVAFLHLSLVLVFPPRPMLLELDTENEPVIGASGVTILGHASMVSSLDIL